LVEAKPVKGDFLKQSTKKHTLHTSHFCHGDPATRHGMKIGRMLLPLLVTAAFATFAVLARSQVPPSFDNSTDTVAAATTEQLDLTYVRPTERTKLNE
jgi:hypothetical protein